MARFYYGGQAVVEGVMMRGRRQATVCVRRSDGDIVSRTEELPAALYARKIARLPFLRGLVMLWEMLILGMRMMLFSANVRAKADLDGEIPKSLVGIMLTFSLTFAVGVFFVMPLLLARASSHVVQGTLASNALEGAVRLALFVGYLSVIGQMDQMRRVFEYHGAEHKTINAYEHGAELTPQSVKRFSLIHVRCGTAFLLWVVVISIFVFGLLGHPPILVGVLARIVLIPLIAAVSYEILRLGARFYRFAVVRVILQPGLWLQKLTTREPSEDQIEVAIAALLPVLRADGEVWSGGPSIALGPQLEPFVATT
jgi:uncharacterized protein YqhQ